MSWASASPGPPSADSACPKKYLEARLDRERDPELAGWCDGWLAGERRSLVLTGPTGVGKTWQAWACVRELVAEWPPLPPSVSYDRVSHLFHLGPGYAAELCSERGARSHRLRAAQTVHRLQTAPLAIFDELAEHWKVRIEWHPWRESDEEWMDRVERERREHPERTGDWGARAEGEGYLEPEDEWVERTDREAAVLEAIADHRRRAGLATVITSILSPVELRGLLGDRLADLLLGDAQQVALAPDERGSARFPGEETGDWLRRIAAPEPPPGYYDSELWRRRLARIDRMKERGEW